MAEFYENPRQYIQSGSTIADRICRIDAIILQLLDAAAAAADGEDTEEYSLDDGQTKIRASSRSVFDIEKSIRAMEALKQIYVNRYNGFVHKLVDQSANKFAQ